MHYNLQTFSSYYGIYDIVKINFAKWTIKRVSYLLVPYPMSEYDFPEPV